MPSFEVETNLKRVKNPENYNIAFTPVNHIFCSLRYFLTINYYFLASYWKFTEKQWMENEINDSYILFLKCSFMINNSFNFGNMQIGKCLSALFLLLIWIYI